MYYISITTASSSGYRICRISGYIILVCGRKISSILDTQTQSYKTSESKVLPQNPSVKDKLRVLTLMCFTFFVPSPVWAILPTSNRFENKNDQKDGEFRFFIKGQKTTVRWGGAEAYAVQRPSIENRVKNSFLFIHTMKNTLPLNSHYPVAGYLAKSRETVWSMVQI